MRKEVWAEIKKAKFNYRDKIKTEFRSNNLRKAWNGMKKMIGCHLRGDKAASLEGFNSDSQVAKSLNDFPI